MLLFVNFKKKNLKNRNGLPNNYFCDKHKPLNLRDKRVWIYM